MSLIARCPGCTTLFRVVEDQLKVAQGWVRCGVCGNAFDAAQHLVNPSKAAIRSPTAIAAVPGDFALPASRNPEHPPSNSAGGSSLSEGAMQAPVYHRATPAAFVGSSLDSALAVPPVADPAHRYVVATDSVPSPAVSLPVVALATDMVEPVVDSIFAAAPNNPEELDGLAFVREANRRVFWKRPDTRFGLGLLLGLLLIGLALQWMVREKDALVAQEPRLAPLIATLCQPLGCMIRPLRRIDSVVIDSASFTKSGNAVYRLAFVFKNNSAADLEVPAIEFTLTNVQDQALVRRVVQPAEFGVTTATLAGRSELSAAVLLQLATQAGNPLPVVGYRIVAFYP